MPSRLARRRSTGSVSFARIGNSSTSPCWWRSSGRSEMPSCMASPRRARPDRAAVDPDLAAVGPGDAEQHLRRPPSGRRRPGRRSPGSRPRADRSSRPRRSRRRTARARSATGAPISAASLGKKAARSVPTMCRTVCSGVSSAAGQVMTRRPERRIVTSSPMPQDLVDEMADEQNRDALLLERAARSRTGGRPRCSRSPRSARP